WVQFHHAVIDGVPAQEALTRLADSWGRRATVTFPPADRTLAPILCGRAHGRSVERRQCFVDFAPLLTLRKALDARLDTAVTRHRQSPAYRAVARLGLLPAPLIHECLVHNPEFGDATFGTFGVCLIRDAQVFLPPMPDVSLDGGFLGIGNMSLPTAEGGRVGSANFAAPAGKVFAYPDALRRAIETCGDLV